MSLSAWKPLDPARARELADARLQIHHLVQLATALGISYLEAADDDSHTNLEWMAPAGALASRPIEGVQVVVRVHDLGMEVAGSSLSARGKTVGDVADWIREQLSRRGLDPSRYTLERHYDLPHHPVADGAQFDAAERDLEQLSAWFADAAMLLESLRARDSRAAEVRCWPHHFDIATLLAVDGGRTVGVGLEPGDDSYDEPYFYVNMSPRPAPAELSAHPLRGGGAWHTKRWIGAVLRGSELTGDAADQEGQARAFLVSAVQAAESLVR